MYKIYGAVQSRALRVIWMLEELGVDYEYIPHKPGTPEAFEVNPVSGKLPVFEDDGKRLTDSAAILTYLADKHSAFTAPAGTFERAEQDAITHAILDEIDAVLWTAARHSFVLPKERRVPDVKPSLAWEFGRNLDRLAERLKGPYLMGDDMTIADIILVHCLGWAYSAKFEITNDTIKAYAKMVRQRDAYQRVMALIS